MEVGSEPEYRKQPPFPWDHREAALEPRAFCFRPSLMTVGMQGGHSVFMGNDGLIGQSDATGLGHGRR